MELPMTKLNANVSRKLAAQSRSMKLLGASAIVSAAAIGIFWLGLLGAPKPVEASVSPTGLDPNQIALGTARDLPSFDATYERHMGVLDTLSNR
jgi:hypothetical protein